MGHRAWSGVKRTIPIVTICMLAFWPSGLVAQHGGVTTPGWGEIEVEEEGRLEIRVVDASDGQPAVWEANASSFPLTTYVIRPSERAHIKCIDLVEGPSRRAFDIECRKFTGEIVPNCEITMNHSVVPGSGGHDHDGSRPQGEFAPSTGNTGATGCCFHTVYTAPEAAGVTQVSGVGVDPQGTRYFGDFTIGVLHYDFTLSGVRVMLGALPAGENYRLIGSRPQHVENHYGTPAFNAALVIMANAYAASFPEQKLEYNDMSLIGGGVFDLDFNWMSPNHCYHRRGRNMDLQTERRDEGGLVGVPVGNRRELRRIAEKKAGLQVDVETAPLHWHLTFVGQL